MYLKLYLTFNFIYWSFATFLTAVAVIVLSINFVTLYMDYCVCQEFQSAHVHNNLINFQKADGVAVTMGQLAQYGSGLTNPAGSCPIVTVNSICFLNTTVFVMYMCTWFGFLCFFFFGSYFFFSECQSVRDRTALTGTDGRE